MITAQAELRVKQARVRVAHDDYHEAQIYADFAILRRCLARLRILNRNCAIKFALSSMENPERILLSLQRNMALPTRL